MNKVRSYLVYLIDANLWKKESALINRISEASQLMGGAAYSKKALDGFSFQLLISNSSFLKGRGMLPFSHIHKDVIVYLIMSMLICACTATLDSTDSTVSVLSSNTNSKVPTANIETTRPTDIPTPRLDTAIPTPHPSTTPTPIAVPASTSSATPTTFPARVQLSPLNHQWQTLNNCHRASIAILMAFYDVWFTQHDYDLGMDNLDEFVAPYGLSASVYAVRYATQQTSDIVRWLLAEDIPVIIGQDLARDNNTWHYRVAYGYDDASQEIFLDDPLIGPNFRLSYEMFNSLSRGVGQLIPVYPSEMDEFVQEQMKAWQMKLIEYP